MPTTTTHRNLSELRRLLQERKTREQRATQDNLPDPFGELNADKFDNNHRRDIDIGVPLYGNSNQRAAFQEHLANPDIEALTEAAERTSSPELVDHVLDERAAQASEQFVNTHPGYQQDDLCSYELVRAMAAKYLGCGRVLDPNGENQDEIIREIAAKGQWTTANLAEVYRQLVADGVLHEGGVRNLTDAQLLEVSRIATSDPHMAVAHYVLWALGYDPAGSTFKEKDAFLTEVLNNPKYRELADRAVFYCWKCFRAEYQPTPERDDFLIQHAAGRAVNFPLLNAAFDALKRHEQSPAYAVRQQAQPTQEEVAARLEQLDDDVLQSTYRAVMTDRAQRIRQAVNSYKTPHEQLQQLKDDFENAM